jgi:hypothetical protein
VAAKYILAALSVVFLVMGTFGVVRGGGRLRAQHRSWLLVGVAFAAVSAWLFFQG